LVGATEHYLNCGSDHTGGLIELLKTLEAWNFEAGGKVGSRHPISRSDLARDQARGAIAITTTCP
jgi:hypothetical protein